MIEFVTMRVVQLPVHAEGMIDEIAMAAVYLYGRKMKARVVALHETDFSAIETRLSGEVRGETQKVNLLGSEKTMRAIKLHTAAGTLMLVPSSGWGDIGLPQGVALLGREVWA